jgi:hypothetical protein
VERNTLWLIWLRHCATNRKVAGSIHEGGTGILYWHNTSGRPMALVLTHPRTEMSTRNISWREGGGGRGGRWVGLTTLPLSCSDCLKIWGSQLPAMPRACPGLCRDYFAFTFIFTQWRIFIQLWSTMFFKGSRKVILKSLPFTSRDLTWRKQSDRSVNLRHKIQC